MTNDYTVVIELLGKRQAEVEIVDQGYESKPHLSLPEGIRCCSCTGIALAYSQR